MIYFKHGAISILDGLVYTKVQHENYGTALQVYVKGTYMNGYLLTGVFYCTFDRDISPHMEASLDQRLLQISVYWFQSSFIQTYL